MNSNTADIHIERMNSLFNDILYTEDDFSIALKKTRFELWGCFSDASDKTKHKKSNCIMWLKYCQEQTESLLSYYQQISEELSDIEEEINRDEVNNAE